ncbi:hypothetical protein [Staphylococcus phage PMBT8]|nr:hypothetical protein [Staphylococcus phage PMBT8]
MNNKQVNPEFVIEELLEQNKVLTKELCLIKAYVAQLENELRQEDNKEN